MAAAAEADDLLDEERLERRMEYHERGVYFETQQSGWSDAVWVAERDRTELEDERARVRGGRDILLGVTAYDHAYDVVEPEDRFEGVWLGGI